MVQHRTPSCLRHHWPGAGAFLCRSRDRQGGGILRCLQPPDPACLFHPGGRGRSGQSRRDFRSGHPRGAGLQVRLRLRLELLAAAGRGRAALRRRYLLRPDELPQDFRPRGRGDQERRHYPPRRQDGRGRYRSSRHREVHRLEGRRGEEGRGVDRGRLFERFQRRGLRHRLRSELE